LKHTVLTDHVARKLHLNVVLARVVTLGKRNLGASTHIVRTRRTWLFDRARSAAFRCSGKHSERFDRGPLFTVWIDVIAGVLETKFKLAAVIGSDIDLNIDDLAPAVARDDTSIAETQALTARNTAAANLIGTACSIVRTISTTKAHEVTEARHCAAPRAPAVVLFADGIAGNRLGEKAMSMDIRYEEDGTGEE